jgi:hypothetical protein
MRSPNYYRPHDDKIYRIDIPLSNFKLYINEMEQFIIDKGIKNTVDEENEYENGEYEDDDSHFMSSIMFFTSDRYRYLIEFPSILRTSVFLSLYSFLENQLVILCKQIQNKKRIALGVNDINGNGIVKASKYLKKVVGIDFPDQAEEWTYIKHCNQLRNCLVHNGGIVNEENKKILKAIEAIPSVTSNYNLLDKELRLEKEFCLDFIHIIDTLWERLKYYYLEVLYPPPYY